MQPINWAKPELVIGKKKPFHFTGKMILTIHKMSCENLYPCDSNNKSDPFIIMYLADEKIQKTAVIKETIFPVFEHLEWVVEVGPTDSIKFEVYDWDRIGKSTFEGQIVFPNVTYLCEYPMQRKQQAFVLTATDPSNSKKASRIRGTITIEVSLEPKIETTPRHFKRPLKESLLQAEKDKILHVTQLCIYSIMKEHLQAEGIFRLPGSAPEVKALRDKVDNGEKVDLSSTFVHNVGSLFKSYFMELPTALLPEDLYDQFKKCYQEQEIDKKIEVTKALFSQIPECNRRVFIDLVNLLSSISKYSEINFMAPKNLAICFAPTVIIPKQLANDAQTALIESPSVTSHLAFIVENLDDIFPVVPDPFASLPAPKLEIPAEVVPEVPEQTEKVEKTPPPSINIEDSGSQLEDNLGSRKGSTSTPVELSQIRSSPSKEDLSIDEATEKIHSNRPSSEEDLLYQVRGKKSKSLGKPKGLIKKEVPLSARNEEGKEEGNLYSSPDKVMMKTTSMKRIPRKSTSGIKPFGKKKEDDVIETLEEEQSATAPALLHASSMSVIPTIPPPPPPPPKKRSNRFAPAPRSTSHTNFKPRLTADAGKVKRKKTMGKKDKKDRIDIQDAMEQLDKIMERLDEKDLKNFKEFMIQLAREED
uniref:Rho-GAP domain-containing protein n=1 Tax=Arcella intermedia TaxID=1963864 RepID=A0A6B2KZK3_9EUKA